MNEQMRLEMKAMLDKIQADMVRRVISGEPWTPGDATTCAPPAPSENLTADSLMDTIGLFRRKHQNPLERIGGMPLRESEHLAISQARWARMRRSWRARLFGGSIPFWRASVLLIVLLLATAVSWWFALALPVLSLRPRRWTVAQGPRKIYEQVPDPDYYVMDGMVLAHPATMARLEVELARMEQEVTPRMFTFPTGAFRPSMTRAKYRRMFGVSAMG